MPTYSVTVNGVERECRLASFDLRESINRVAVLACEFLSEDASFRPQIDQELIVEEVVGSPATRIFGGVIEFAEEVAADGHVATDAIVTQVNAVGFSSYADRRYVNATLAAGTLKSQLTTLVAYLSAYGVTLDPAQVDGPSMPELVCAYRKLTDVLNDLSSLSSGSGGSPNAPYLWEIDYEKTLRMFQIGTSAAPVDLIEGDGVEVGDLAVKPTRESYANRVILRSAGGLVTIADDTDEQDDHELWETVIDTQADLSEAVAEQAAAGLLSQFSQAQAEARYNTVALGLRPGQTQTITAPKRNVDASFLITEVATRQEPNNDAMMRSIVALSGYRLQGSWMDVLARWTSGVNGVGIVGSGGTGGFGGSVGGGFGGGGGGGLSACETPCAGDLLFSGYGDSPVKALSPNGAALALTNTPTLSTTGGCGGIATIPSGSIGVAGVTVLDGGFDLGAVVAYTPLLGLAGFTSGESPCWSIAATASKFYTLRSDIVTNTEVLEFNSAGTITDRIDLGEIASGLPYTVLGVRFDAGKVYFGKGNGSVVKVRDVGGASTSTFVDESASSYQLIQNSIVVLPNGQVLVGWHKSGQGIIRRYSTAGATLATYTPSSTDAFPVCVTLGRPNGTSFWVSYYTTNAATFSGVRVEEYDVASGSVLNSIDPEDGTFEFDGPFCVLRDAA